MPPFHNKFHWLMICITAPLITFVVKGDSAKYGMRIRPLQPVVPKPFSPQVFNPSHDNKTELQRKRDDKILLNNPQITQRKATRRTGEIRNQKDDTTYITNPLVKIQQRASPIYSAFPNQNSSQGTTFFFTQKEPHRFEYRAMFQHHSNSFQPFTHDFEAFSKEYPPLPKFPSFPDFSEFFLNNYDPFPKLPEFTFPTLPPDTKRVWNQVPEVKTPPKPDNFEIPLIKDYDVVLGHSNYPKIFRFNEERMNIEEFDRQKKIKYYNLAKAGSNNLAETENVKRDQLLILHGGIYTVKEPPLFNKHFKKRRKLAAFGRQALNF